MFWGSVPSNEMIAELERQLARARFEHWLSDNIFTFQWWLLVVVLIVPWFIWWRYVDRKRLLEICLVGAMALIIASFLDAVLSEIVVWSYEFKVIPVWPRLISADFALLPVTYMFIYQYFREWKQFLLAMVVVSVLFAFVGEPFLIWLDIYKLHSWKHVYSFPIYIALGVLVKWLVQGLLAHTEN